MGVKYARKYAQIIGDMMRAIAQMDNFYEFFQMNGDDWGNLDEAERQECLRTMSDDVFYGLGYDSTISIGSGIVKYDKNNNIIKLYNGDRCVSIVNLI